MTIPMNRNETGVERYVRNHPSFEDMDYDCGVICVGLKAGYRDKTDGSPTDPVHNIYGDTMTQVSQRMRSDVVACKCAGCVRDLSESR